MITVLAGGARDIIDPVTGKKTRTWDTGDEPWWEQMMTSDTFINSTEGRLLLVLGIIVAWSVAMMFLMESPPPEKFRNNVAYHTKTNIHDKKTQAVTDDGDKKTQ
jgi:hypothetical protein